MNVITVTRPNLTDEERRKRLIAVKQAAKRLIVETEKQKRSTK